MSKQEDIDGWGDEDTRRDCEECGGFHTPPMPGRLPICAPGKAGDPEDAPSARWHSAEGRMP